MKKLLIKFFPLLLILLLGGQGTLYANAYGNDVDNFLLNKIESHESVDLEETQNGWDFIIKHVVLSDVEEEDFEICAIDDSESEEEKLISIKKSLEISNYYTSSFYTQTLEYFCHHIKKRLSLHRQFLSFTSSSKYITLRVIRL